jgi:hypothetical protein
MYVSFQDKLVNTNNKYLTFIQGVPFGQAIRSKSSPVHTYLAVGFPLLSLTRFWERGIRG